MFSGNFTPSANESKTEGTENDKLRMTATNKAAILTFLRQNKIKLIVLTHILMIGNVSPATNVH